MRLGDTSSLNQQGLTLVELLVAITIIAIIALIGLTVFTGLQSNARDSKRRADVNAISEALELHYNYTLNQKCTGDGGTYCPVQSTWFSGHTIPKDPQTGSDYQNIPTSSSAIPTYTICTTLESGISYCRSQRQ
jgi:prepilin-type N-terminal cleavage/methylation domain-containing protein